MSRNYIFRAMECQMTKEEVAKLCFKSVRTVTEWQQFKMHYDKLELPSGQIVSPQQILAGIALLSIQSELEIKTSRHLIKIARAIARIL